ncbi:MAG: PAS domain S-box protein [Candidatus Scalindua sp.]|nr:PAS domain S-box protein [Candidatus Scalindua sp.]MBT6563563.1 PAS domain S-box protein [Candidatus Scalindua sp.]MBT7211934.1 PAS domain S-box protein [Candidatus Scalindua sp.]MBT7589441.1 PAS domain S-box protein [Candidatus Scalindua sp.]
MSCFPRLDTSGGFIGFVQIAKDITKHKHIEEQNKKLSCAIEQSPVTVVITDTEANIEYVNSKFYQLTGYTEHEVIGQNPRILKTGNTSPEEYKEMWKNITSGGEWSGDFCNKKKSGQIYWENAKISSIKNSKGIITNFIAIKEDITERKKAEGTLKDRVHDLGERYKELGGLYALSEIINQVEVSLEDTLQGAAVLISPAWQYPDITCGRIVFEDKEFKTDNFKKTKWMQSADIIVAGNKAGVVEVCYLQEKPEIDEGPFLKEERDLVNGFAHQLSSFIERKLIGETLKTSEENFRAISTAANDSIIMINDDNYILFCNVASERLFGFEKEELIGKKIYETIIPDNFRADHIKGFKSFKNTEQGSFIGKTVELTAIHKDGTEFPIELSLSAVKIKKKWNAIGIIRDITERKKMLQKLKNSEKRNRVWLDSSPVCTKIVDLDFNLKYMSAAGIKALKIDDVTQLYEKPYPFDFFPESFRISMTKNLEKVKETGEIITGEDPVCDIEGNELWFQATLVPVNDSEGRIDYIVVVSIDITERKKAEEKEKLGIEKLKKTTDGVVKALALTVEQRDPYTAGHQQRVSELGCAIAEEMGLSENQVAGIRTAGILHDIGKIHIPGEILSRPSKLTKDEFNIVRTHAQAGYDILEGIEFPWPIADIVHQHHEHVDGSGYPLGLSNNDILIEARILCVADVVEAMSSHRPYRPALGIDKALEEVCKSKGICYDSDVVDACLKVIKEKGFVFE